MLRKKCVCLIERERDSEGGTKKDLRGKRGFVHWIQINVLSKLAILAFLSALSPPKPFIKQYCCYGHCNMPMSISNLVKKIAEILPSYIVDCLVSLLFCCCFCCFQIYYTQFLALCYQPWLLRNMLWPAVNVHESKYAGKALRFKLWGFNLLYTCMSVLLRSPLCWHAEW